MTTQPASAQSPLSDTEIGVLRAVRDLEDAHQHNPSVADIDFAIHPTGKTFDQRKESIVFTAETLRSLCQKDYLKEFINRDGHFVVFATTTKGRAELDNHAAAESAPNEAIALYAALLARFQLPASANANAILERVDALIAEVEAMAKQIAHINRTRG